jgi:Ca-activated chloride channel family protein
VRPLVWCLYFLACLTVPAGASAWSPLRGENSNAKKGNTLMAQEQYGPALEAYDEAARELPEARAVQLNRGLALLAQDLGEQAKEAFLAAADPKAAPTTRADAYYDLGIAHAREGDAISQQEEYEQASAHFREAADAFKRSLRQRPGDRNAAWNLEYAMKRIREEKEKQDQQDQQDQEQEQDSENESQDQEQEQDSENESQDQEQEQDSENESQDQEQEQEQDSENESQDQEQEQEQQPQPVPQDEVQRFLDALEQNEENLPLQRARRRNAGRPPPEKDW